MCECARAAAPARLPAPTNPPLLGRRVQVLPLCESLAGCGLLAISDAPCAGSRGRESGPSRDAMSRSVWLCISDDDLKLATEELHLLKQILQKCREE